MATDDSPTHRTALPPAAGINRRLDAMLRGPILATLFGLAWPNVLMMLAQSSTGLVETWFLSRLGTDALAGAALVVPVLMLMQNMSQGAMGGGISSAIARALGAGRADEAHRLVLQAVLLNGGLGLVFSALLFAFGPWLFRTHGRRAGRAGRGARILERARRRAGADVDHERTGERGPRHRQHAGSRRRDLRRRAAAGAAVERTDLRLGAGSRRSAWRGPAGPW